MISRITCLCIILTGCLSTFEKNSEPIPLQGFSDLKQQMLDEPRLLDFFAQQGPFGFEVLSNYDIRLARDEQVASDLYLSQHNQKAPLVIIQHGNESWKEAHKYQAMHLATWGMHCLVLQLPNTQNWMNNGATISKLVNLLYRWPDLVTSGVDVNRIIIAGHSFGGSAAVVAAGSGAPVSGLILLDPAIVKQDVVAYLQKVNVPVMLLGADERVFQSRKRSYFFKYIRRGIAEVSLSGATHNDAQYPSQTAVKYLGLDPFRDEDMQKKFVASLTAAAFSLGATGNLDYGWQSFSADLKLGRMFKAKRK